MALYTYKNPKTGEIFEEFAPMKDYQKPFVTSDGVVCPRVFYVDTNEKTYLGIINKNAEVFQKDSTYVRKMNPKYVKFRDGHRERFDSTRHC